MSRKYSRVSISRSDDSSKAERTPMEPEEEREEREEAKESSEEVGASEEEEEKVGEGIGEAASREGDDGADDGVADINNFLPLLAEASSFCSLLSCCFLFAAACCAAFCAACAAAISFAVALFPPRARWFTKCETNSLCMCAPHSSPLELATNAWNG